MEESQYMDRRQLAYFKEKLSAIAERLVSQMSAIAGDVIASDVQTDPVDRASYEESRMALLAAHARDGGQLATVNKALARIDGGEFGWCSESGEPIGLRRLLAQPTATLSLEAQTRLEAKKLYFKN
jgi:DnaK suppressor protein